MFKLNLPFSAIDSVISINADFKSITFYSVDKKNNSNIFIEQETYKAKPFEQDFYEMLKNSVALRFKNAQRSGRVALILPDSLFLMDTIKIPIIQKKAMANSLGLAIDELYKNSKNIKFVTSFLTRDKKTATYSILGVRKEIIAKVTDAVERAGASVSAITFNANALVNGAIALNSKLKTASYVLVDIKQEYSSFAFVVRGRIMGYYTLPIGHSIISDDVVKDEITLFDHTAGDLLVLNATQMAKHKPATSLEDEQSLVQRAVVDDGDLEDEDNQSVGTLYKRLNRKLPKFMLRPNPTTKEEFEIENFRPFVKWALELIRNNAEVLALGNIDTVYVNMPNKFSHILKAVNSEQEQNNVVFAPLVQNEQNEVNRANLGLFGGLYIKKYNTKNNF